MPIEIGSRPARPEVAPLDQLPASRPQPLDRPIVVASPPGSGDRAERRRERRTPSGVILQGALQPGVERFGVQAARFALGQDAEERVDARLDRALAQQVGAKAMNGADVRFFEVHQGRVETLARGGIQTANRLSRRSSSCRRRSFSSPAAFSVNVTATRSPTPRLPCCEHANDAAHQLGGLARAGSSLDDKRRVEIGGDRVARVLIVERPVMARASSQLDQIAQRIRRLARDPQLLVRSADRPEVAPGAGTLVRRGGEEAELDRAVDDLQRLDASPPRLRQQRNRPTLYPPAVVQKNSRVSATGLPVTSSIAAE